jgi:hypothetical protein
MVTKQHWDARPVYNKGEAVHSYRKEILFDFEFSPSILLNVRKQTHEL